MTIMPQKPLYLHRRKQDKTLRKTSINKVYELAKMRLD